VPRPPLLLAVFAGGCVGGLARYGVTQAFPDGDGLPASTLAVNLAGAFLLAVVLVVAIEVVPSSSYLRPLLGTGFCGAFTTFSAVTVSTSELVRDGSPATGLAYLVASLLGGLATAVLGLLLGRALFARRVTHALPLSDDLG
jgi:CrcB protein